MDKTTTTLILSLIAFGIIIYTLRGFGPELPTPGQELLTQCITNNDCQSNYNCTDNKCTTPYPKNTNCRTTQVTEYGKPTYYKDPKMTHMIGQTCITDNQCQKWPPETQPTNTTSHCCVDTGNCVINL